jgi:predicted transposase/invertase (TIGR01784 family)
VKHKKTEDGYGDIPGHNPTPAAGRQPAETRPGPGTSATHLHAHPHDRIFKEIFAAMDAQQDLVTMVLPPEITSRFRQETIRDAGQEGGSGRADLVLTVETIDDTTEYVYVLVEHKSRPAPMVAVQLMGYVAEIMKRHMKPPIPVVYPVVFYHGRERWTVPTELTALHAPGSVPTDYPVNLRYRLLDLATIPPERIAAHTRARAHMGMIIMKYALQHRLKDRDIQYIAATIVRSEVSEDLQDTMMFYFYQHFPAEYKQPLMTAIDENVYTEEEERRMRTIADALQEEGLMKGIERGKADVLVRQLGRRFGITPEEEAIVRDCHDPDRLDAAAEACVDPVAGKDEILVLLR